MPKTIKTPIAIIGGGPAGLMVAIELGRRAVEAVIIEPNTRPPEFPKANATTSRSMEHYRRLGFADKIRAKALPESYPTDITYFTRYSSSELARLKGADLKPKSSLTAKEDNAQKWPTAEPLARVQQMNVEAVLRQEVAKYSSITFLTGWHAKKIDQQQDKIIIEIERTADESTAKIANESLKTQNIQCTYLVGADGPRSIARQFLGVKYAGHSEFDRDFFGGKMLATYFRSNDFYKKTGEKSWQYWAINPEQRGLICAIDGASTFVHHTPIIENDNAPTYEDACTALEAAMGVGFEYDILEFREWTAGFALVAEQMADKTEDPHIFLCGDAAHLFTPTGGQGYNTAVDDAVNLGWKLAAVLNGWGGDNLLASYESERKPIAHRNTSFARAMAESIGRLPVPENIESQDSSGAKARGALSQKLYEHANTEFNIPGITYGIFYKNSNIIIDDGAEPPEDNWNLYHPSSIPGARAPHIWIDAKHALHDLLGQNFSLLCFTNLDANEQAICANLHSQQQSLDIISLNHDQAQALYEFDRILIRPDHHIAWRGHKIPQDFDFLFQKVRGFK